MKKNQRLIAVLIVSVLALVALSACSSNKATEGLQYKALEDGTYAVSGYTGSAVDVNIPAEYNDVKVTVIDEDAFAGTQIQSISGGKNLVSIGEDAFEKCYMLKSVDLKGDITEIGDETFEECKNLESIEFPKTLKSIGDEAFYKCESLKKVEFPESLEEIGGRAFKDCNSIKNVKIPASVNEQVRKKRTIDKSPLLW